MSRSGLALLAMLPLALGAAMSGVHSGYQSPANPEGEAPQSNQELDPATKSTPSESDAAKPQLSPASSGKSSAPAPPADKSAPASPTRANPDEPAEPSLYANSSTQRSVSDLSLV